MYVYCTTLQLSKNFHNENKVGGKLAGRALFKIPSPFFPSYFDTFLLGEGDIRVQAIYFVKEPHMILIYISTTARKSTWIKQCQNLH